LTNIIQSNNIKKNKKKCGFPQFFLKKSILYPKYSGKQDTVKHPLLYASKKLIPREQNYSVGERVALAIIWAVKKDIDRETDDMLAMEVIERSEVPYASPYVLVKKPDNT